MQILFGIANSVNDYLPFSGLCSLDSFKTSLLFEKDNIPENAYTIWSDRIRNQYKNYWKVMDKYQLNDNWEGKPIKLIQDFLSELLEKQVEIQKISVSIDGRGYNVYTVILKDVVENK